MGSSELSLLCRVVGPRLDPVVERAGFVVVGGDGPGDEDNEVVCLEYRSESDERCVLLDFCQIRARQMISATLWSPDDLARARADDGVETIATHHCTWRYDASTDLDALAGEIVSAVAAWLEEAPWARTTR